GLVMALEAGPLIRLDGPLVLGMNVQSQDGLLDRQFGCFRDEVLDDLSGVPAFSWPIGLAPESLLDGNGGDDGNRYSLAGRFGIVPARDGERPEANDLLRPGRVQPDLAAPVN